MVVEGYKAITRVLSFHILEHLRPSSVLYILFVYTILDNIRCFFYVVVTQLPRRWLYYFFANLNLLKVLSAGVNVLIYILLFWSIRLIVFENYSLLYQVLLYVPDWSCRFRMLVDISFEVGLSYFKFRILRNLLFVYRHSHFSWRCSSRCCWFCSCWLSYFNFS